MNPGHHGLTQSQLNTDDLKLPMRQCLDLTFHFTFTQGCYERDTK